MGLFSVITLFAHQHITNKGVEALRRTAWYAKSHPTFSDALAVVRKQLWAADQTFCRSSADSELVKVPREFMERLTDALCYAA